MGRQLEHTSLGVQGEVNGSIQTLGGTKLGIQGSIQQDLQTTCTHMLACTNVSTHTGAAHTWLLRHECERSPGFQGRGVECLRVHYVHTVALEPGRHQILWVEFRQLLSHVGLLLGTELAPPREQYAAFFFFKYLFILF